MASEQLGKFLEPLCVSPDFRFDAPSPDLQRIKSELCLGRAVVLEFTDAMTDASGEESPVMLVNFLMVNGRKFIEDMHEVHGEYVVEVHGEHIMELGAACHATKSIMDMIAGGCDVYLVPEESEAGSIAGRYTLVGRAF